MKQEDFKVQEPIRSPEKEIDVRAVLAENLALKSEVEELKQALAAKDELISQFKKTIYGQKSEKTEYITNDSEQLTLFNEAECEENRRERQAEEPIVVAEHSRKKKRTHEEMTHNLPTEEVLHKADRTDCAVCGAALEVVGREFVRDELVYVPACLFVRKHYAEVLKCSVCGNDEDKDSTLPDIAKQCFVKAAVTSPMIPHSFCSPELLAHIAYEKYCNGMPLYRLEKDFAAHGVQLSRATMANWLIYAAKEWLQPIWSQMKSELLQQSVIHADETVVQVLHEPGRKATDESRMWVYCAGELDSEDIVLFEYQPTRSGDHAVKFLKDYHGYLVCDGYGGYNKLNEVTRCGCWAHVRRKFVEALPASKEQLPGSQAAIGVDYCNKLFALERELSHTEPEIRLIKRQESAKPILDDFFAWLKTVRPAGGTKLSKAFAYALEQKKYLTAYLDNPLVPISNNRAENAIRPFVIGRKQWLFSDSVKGAQSSAILYSLAATACANKFNVEQYFTELFRVLPQLKDQTLIPGLLPRRNN